jgi:hypothetical protein
LNQSFIDAFVSATQKYDRSFLYLPCQYILFHRHALWAKIYQGCVPAILPNRLDGILQRLHLHQHSWTTSVGPVIYGSMTIPGVIPWIPAIKL